MASQLAFKTLKATFLTTNRITHNASISHAAKEKLKSLKIPDKPKRPMSAFFKFVQDRRGDILKEKPELKIGDVAKQCAVEWASLHNNIKEKYNTEYQNELEKYSKLAAEFQTKLTSDQKQALIDINEGEKKRKERREIKKNFRDEDRPKRPLGPYPLFLLEQSKKAGGMGLSEVIQSVKGIWQQLPESERQRYQKIHDEDKKRYESEMLVWEKKMIAEGKDNLVRGESLKHLKPVIPSKIVADHKKSVKGGEKKVGEQVKVKSE